MKLRDRTGLGMGDCKSALTESNGDIEAAEKLLRKKMKVKMDARADRAAGKGCVSVMMEGSKAAIIDRVDAVRLKTGENMSFARGVVLEVGGFASYVHHDSKLGVLLQYEATDGATLPQDIGTGIRQHIAAAVPTRAAIDSSGLDQAIVAEKRAEAVAEAQASGKPAQIAEKIAEGKMRKFFEEVTLLGQPYVRDDKVQVASVLPKGIKLVRFVRIRLGQE